MAPPTRKAPNLPNPPLGIVASIVSGFETVNARLELVLLPLALDLFLWLGPHLSVKPVLDRLLALLLALLATPAGADAAAAQNLEAMRQGLTTAFTANTDGSNLFVALSTMPLGLPSLMSLRRAVLVPGGAPVIWYVDSALEYVLLFIAFSLLGLFLGALYFGGIAQQVRDVRLRWGRLLKEVWGDWARLTALTAVAFVIAGLLFVPVSVFASLLALINPVLASFFLATLLLWLVVYLGFTLHGIVLQRRGLFGAVWDSIRLAHSSLPQTLTLYTAVIFLYLGLSLVWNIPTDDSWLLLIGVGGHALVATGLIAATFAFYKDRYRWWIEMRQTLQAQTQTKRGGASGSTKA